MATVFRKFVLIVFGIYAVSPGTMTDMTKMATVMPRRLLRDEFSSPQHMLSIHSKLPNSRLFPSLLPWISAMDKKHTLRKVSSGSATGEA